MDVYGSFLNGVNAGVAVLGFLVVILVAAVAASFLFWVISLIFPNTDAEIEDGEDE